MAYLGNPYDWLQGMPRLGTLPGSVGGQPSWGSQPGMVSADLGMGGGNTGLMAGIGQPWGTQSGVRADQAPGVMAPGNILSGGTSYWGSPQPIIQNGQTIGYMPTTSDYTNSLSPADRQARLQTLKQSMPGASDEALQYFDTGSYYGQPGPYQNYLNRPPTQWELAAKARSDAENSNRGFWNDAGRPLLASGAAAIGTGGLSIFGQAAQTGGGPGPQMPVGTETSPTGGNMSSGGLFDNLLGNLGNLSPAILAGYLGNQQRQGIMGQVGRLNDLGASLSGPGFMNSITNPYDLQTGLGRTALTQNLQQRGVGGSSFGNQQLGNYDYMRGLGRGDLATRAQAGIAGTQGQLYSDALRGMVGGNLAYNQLLGAGLGASGSLFNRPGGTTGNGLFDWLRNLGGTGTAPNSIGPTPDPNTSPPVDFGNDPFYVPPPEDYGAFF